MRLTLVLNLFAGLKLIFPWQIKILKAASAVKTTLICCTAVTGSLTDGTGFVSVSSFVVIAFTTQQ